MGSDCGPAAIKGGGLLFDPALTGCNIQKPPCPLFDIPGGAGATAHMAAAGIDIDIPIPIPDGLDIISDCLCTMPLSGFAEAS